MERSLSAPAGLQIPVMLHYSRVQATVMRDEVKEWGVGLSERDFAAALLALGCTPRSDGDSISEIRTAFEWQMRSAAETWLSWDAGRVPGAIGSWASDLASELASWVQEAEGAAVSLGNEVRSPTAVEDSATSWLVIAEASELFRLHLGISRQFFISPAARRVRWRWPSRIGFFPESEATPAAAELGRRDDRRRAIYEVGALSRRHPECEMLLWLASEGQEELRLVAMSIGGVDADLLVVSGPRTWRVDLAVGWLEKPGNGVRTSGVLSVPKDVDPAACLHRLYEGISNGLPLPHAVWEAVPGGLLIADRYLLDAARMQSQKLRLSRVLQDIETADASLKTDPGSNAEPRRPQGSFRGKGDRPSEAVSGEQPFGMEVESREASAIGRASRAMREAARRRGRARYLQVGVYDNRASETPLAEPLRVGEYYWVTVFIAERDSRYLSGDDPLPEPEPADDGSAHRLTVVLWEPDLASEPETREIQLPPRGNSSVCHFFYFVPPEKELVQARITVLHRGRVLQTGMLELPVGESERRSSFRLDAVPRAVLSGMDERLAFDAAFVLNDVAGRGVLHEFRAGRSRAVHLDPDEARALVAVYDDALTDITCDPDEYEGLRAKGTTTLLRRLAQKGAMFRKNLQRHSVEGGLPRTAYLQIVAAKRQALLPLEFVYERKAPRPEARLCDGAEEALAKGTCPGTCPAIRLDDGTIRPAAENEVICPLAFWGVHSVIERRAHKAEHARLDSDFRLQLDPPSDSERRTLYPLKSILVAATPKANEHDEETTSRMLARIRDVVGEAKTRDVDTWDDWVQGIQDKPQLLALLVHQERDHSGTPLLVIRPEERLLSDLVEPEHVRAEGAPQPILLLLGCETAIADRALEDFMVRFQDEGAAFVVGTIAKVLGRQAGPLMAELVERLHDVESPTPFAEILRDVRQQGLAKGLPMVLALTAYGDADWDVVGTI